MKYMTTLLIINFIIISTGIGQITGKIETDAGKIKYKANTVVYIEHINGEFSPPEKNPVINQIGLKFVPHTLPVLKGSTVDFLNSDNVLHNVFSPDKCANKFNLGNWPRGEVRSHKYDNFGCESVLLCNVHPEMEAYVIVLQNPYFAVTDKEGNFNIENVPPGDYTLKVWNEKLKAKVEQITIPESGTIQINFKLIK
ncbi:MAG: carboxypeptidase regulatory-like domain-containing protein [Bacteroidetes bacterium]|nr:carboxypeptidase regulatory-like domain-containing protein [Bacteroidota bacterium]